MKSIILADQNGRLFPSGFMVKTFAASRQVGYQPTGWWSVRESNP
ncbi:MAG TPA: hypothetical protein VNQ76_11640 [Planctomicrobium sp.]|nr:hypothetical protein [Planctomicrobium sp.]